MMNNWWIFCAILKLDWQLNYWEKLFDQIPMISLVNTKSTALLSLQNHIKDFCHMKVKLLRRDHNESLVAIIRETKMCFVF